MMLLHIMALFLVSVVSARVDLDRLSSTLERFPPTEVKSVDTTFTFPHPVENRDKPVPAAIWYDDFAAVAIESESTADRDNDQMVMFVNFISRLFRTFAEQTGLKSLGNLGPTYQGRRMVYIGQELAPGYGGGAHHEIIGMVTGRGLLDDQLRYININNYHQVFYYEINRNFWARGTSEKIDWAMEGNPLNYGFWTVGMNNAQAYTMSILFKSELLYASTPNYIERWRDSMMGNMKNCINDRYTFETGWSTRLMPWKPVQSINDLMSGFFIHMFDNYGQFQFLERWYAFVEDDVLIPVLTNKLVHQPFRDNNFKLFSLAANFDLTEFFEEDLQWTISSDVKQYVRGRLSQPIVVPRSELSVLRASAATGDNQASNALDGDPNTFWLSSSTEEATRTFQVDLGGMYDVSGLSVLPQASDGNGRLEEYRIYVSIDNDTWLKVARCTAFDTKSLKPVFFEPLKGRYVRIDADEDVKGNPVTSIAELNVYGTPSAPTAPSISPPTSVPGIQPTTPTSPPVPIDPDLGTVGGRYFVDLNNDGFRSAGEPGVGGVKVELYDDIAYRFVGETLTNANGEYMFFNVQPLNRYAVFFTHPKDVSGYKQGYDWTKYNASTDSKVTQTHSSLGTGETSRFPVNGNEVNRIDAGIYCSTCETTKPPVEAPTSPPVTAAGPVEAPTSSPVTADPAEPPTDPPVAVDPQNGFVSGKFFVDLNNDGFRSAGEPGVGGVKVELYDDIAYRFVGETLTNANGEYAFDNVQPLNRYAIFFTHPKDILGYQQGYDWTKYSDSTDSKVKQTHGSLGTGETSRFPVNGNEVNRIDAGIYCSTCETTKPPVEAPTSPPVTAGPGTFPQSWWPSIQEHFVGIKLKGCAKRNDVAPQNGSRCSKQRKTCFFGTQDCNAFTFPTTRCFCTGQKGDRTWQCTTDLGCPASSKEPIE